MSRFGEPEMIVLNGRIEAQTKKAILFVCDWKEGEIWLPKSQIRYTREEEGSNRAEVLVPDWLARKNDLEPPR